jgi:tRNA dimethylallyltransferase
VARTETARATRRFARRQDSWYRKDERIRWVAWDDPRRLDTALTILNGG